MCEPFPFGLLTMIVMISQNRADSRRQALADEQWKTVQAEETENRELLDLSHQILELTRAVREAIGREKIARPRR